MTPRHGHACTILLGITLCSAFLWTGCATNVNSPVQNVLIWSDPLEADVLIDDRIYLKAPGKVQLSRLSSHVLKVQKEGYEPTTVEITRGMSKWVFADVVCLVFIPACVSKDRRDGGFYTFDDKVTVTLTKTPLSEPPPGSPAPPAP